MRLFKLASQVVHYLTGTPDAGNETAEVHIEDDKVFTFGGEGFEDLKPTGEYYPNGSSSPTVKVFRNGHFLPAFSGTGPDETATYRFHLPHDYVEGSSFYFHVHWSNNNASTPSGDVDWSVEWSYSRGYEDGAFDTDITTLLPSATVNATRYEHHITESAAIDQKDITPILRTDGIILATLKRDTSDTNNDDAFMLEFDIHYLSDNRVTVERNDTGSGYVKV